MTSGIKWGLSLPDHEEIHNQTLGVLKFRETLIIVHQINSELNFLGLNFQKVSSLFRKVLCNLSASVATIALDTESVAL